MALVKVNPTRSTSDIQVFEVNARSLADLLVYREESRSLAKGVDHLWYFVDSVSVADTRIFMTSSRATADLLVYYVPTRSLAGWSKQHPLRGKIG
ncbi:DUF6150 family protein [Myroides pelagicus]|uniref:DUF6150 family protein n=1 Tax=Myroides pelagicus TaxID=270914 RepID=UPI002DB91AC1|nr:DUF6150 family protein [Myroides pelagicus]MEC4114093.1 DUF6150 family protein [Myroides pelagicus]